MYEFAEIFSKEELDYLSKKRTDLVPIHLPSLSDAPIPLIIDNQS